MNIYGFAIGVCWFTFFVVWIATALNGGRRTRRFSSGGRLFRLALAAAIVLGVLSGPHLSTFVPGRLAPGLGAAGSVLCIVGLAFAVWARLVLGRNWGMPMTLHESPELVTSGPYRYVRHPIYTGMSAMTIGTALAFPPSWIWAAVMVTYMIFSARREESDMEQRFPDAYPAYRQRSKMLVPFLF